MKTKDDIENRILSLVVREAELNKVLKKSPWKGLGLECLNASLELGDIEEELEILREKLEGML